MMVETVIEVNCLTKTYRVPEREPGMLSSLHSLVKKNYRHVNAVRDISFSMDAGEMVGFIGPNGAGKTTTLKMLSGLLHPTGGTATVLGYVPWKRDSAYLSRISMVLGNKSQMLWDIPPMDTFQVLSEIYRVPKKEFNTTLDELVILLKMDDLLRKPVRNMSLGERMKCELVAGLLYRPDVLFLDEPTLGLDVSMQARLRKFLVEYNLRRGVTVLLTSHYMADVVALCYRIILIHHGEILYDGVLQGLADQLSPFKLIKLTLANEGEFCCENWALPSEVDLLMRENGRLTLRVNRKDIPTVTGMLLDTFQIVDLSIENPPIEAVIDQIYQEGNV
jgi:ABC-2 type transport system ATP-binding protein